MARARACIELERWTEAEAALSQAVLTRPFDTEVLLERARFYSSRSRPDKANDDYLQAYVNGAADPAVVELIVRDKSLFHRAIALAPNSAAALWTNRADHLVKEHRWAAAAADFGQVVRLQPDVMVNLQHQVLSLAMAGDPVEFRRVRAEILDRLGSTTDPQKALYAAWFAAVAPGLDDRADSMIRLAEIAVKGAPDVSWKAASLNGLGAALYRTGRLDDAIRRFRESDQAQNRTSSIEESAFLAMAHHRLGHHDEARDYLDLLRSRQPSTEADQFWNEIQIRLLQSEAEATVLYDAIFPADPFAR